MPGLWGTAPRTLWPCRRVIRAADELTGGDSLFILARQDGARDNTVGRSFWLEPELERSLRAKHLAAIQSLARRAVTADEFVVRGMMVANTQRDYYYSRFSRESLVEAADLLVGAPVMYGHNYSSQPVGRIFDAKVTRVENPDLAPQDQHWLEALYYVPRDADGEAHIRRVDLGISREVSFGWRCMGQECSVCGNAIHRCPHVPGDIYDERGFCEYEFSGITAALEVSHVFRGGQKDTSTFNPDVGAGTATASAPELSLAMRAFVPGTRDIDPASLITAKRHNGALLSQHLFGKQTLEDWLVSGAGERAVGMGALFFGKQGERGNTQAIHVEADRFSSRAAAARWVRDHDFRADRVKQANGITTFEQQPATRFDSNGWRTIRLDKGIEARVGKPASPSQEQAMAAHRNLSNEFDPLAAWLSAGSHADAPERAQEEITR